MQLLETLRERFTQALSGWVDNPLEYAQRVGPARDPRFGDYQAGIAMPLKQQLGLPPMEIATQLVGRLKLDDICLPPEILAPGFINLRIKPEVLVQSIQNSVCEDRLGVATNSPTKTFVIDYSAPNVAKPMHVGHIRSTVIGDALARILRFLGHHVITDNHLGDWGTQFGMIIYGYKHFVDPPAFQRTPVPELSRLYRLIQQLIGYQEAVNQRATAFQAVTRTKEKLVQLQQQTEQPAKHSTTTPTANPTRQGPDSKGDSKGDTKSDCKPEKKADKKADNKADKELKAAARQVQEAEEQLASLEKKISAVQADTQLLEFATAHPDLETRVQLETVKLHHGDAENLKLWNQFMPLCLSELEQVYERLNIVFDYQYGESFYHPMLQPLVDRLMQSGLAKESDGALCVFVPGYEAPMLVRKADGAFLYATTDLATIEYRDQHFHPQVILYVVDHRQGEHFAKLFAAAKTIGYDHIDMRHLAFGTVTGPDGKPFKTRDGSVIGLDYLLDEAVERAHQVVCNPERLQKANLQMSDSEKRAVAEAVGLGAIKYADLSHNRNSDYVFDVDKMVQLEGNTAAYIQYSYARIRSILSNANVTPSAQWASSIKLVFSDPSERALGLLLAQFDEAVNSCLEDYLPSQLTAYLYALAGQYASFYDRCPVLKAENEQLRDSRLLLCHATACTLRLGLSLLGIDVVDRM